MFLVIVYINFRFVFCVLYINIVVCLYAMLLFNMLCCFLYGNFHYSTNVHPSRLLKITGTNSLLLFLHTNTQYTLPDISGGSVSLFQMVSVFQYFSVIVKVSSVFSISISKYHNIVIGIQYFSTLHYFV